MSLAAGTKLGPYEILSPIGAGGMGEVYRAKDTRLDRDVAIKVLPPLFSKSPEFKQRFAREAKAISRLTHPNICTLHDIGCSDGTDFLVMELLEGETLSKRLGKGSLPIEHVLRYGAEIASALDGAHRAGVIHRDLKPGNIMITKSGAKLLDFGLAKSTAGSGLSSEPDAVTITEPLTGKGTIVGTFQYMAPEQLEGKEADTRSDIFAFGAVLYEMATGKRAFSGSSRASLITSIMSANPEPITQIQPMSPPALDHVVRMCLSKDPDDRIQTAHDVKLELQWIAEGGSQLGVPASVGARRKSRERAWIVSTLVLLLVTAGLSIGYLRGIGHPSPLIHAAIPAPQDARFVFTDNSGGPAVISPDGSAIAFTARCKDGINRLWIRSLESSGARVLTGTELAIFPFWSPDSQSVAYFANGVLYRIAVAGGFPVRLCDARIGKGGTWAANGQILISPNYIGPIYQLHDTGGAPTPVTSLEGADYTTHRWPMVLPGGKHFLYFAGHHDLSLRENDAIFFASLDGAVNKMVIRTRGNVAYASGHLLYLRGNTLMAQPFDDSRGELLGAPIAVANDVQYDGAVWRGVFSVSNNGMLLYQTGLAPSGTTLTWFDRKGNALGHLGDQAVYGNLIRISPDGQFVLTAGGDPADVWTFHLRRGVQTRVTADPVEEWGAIWSPDGTQVLYTSRHRPDKKKILFIKSSSGTGTPQMVYESDEEIGATDWSPDGRFLLVFLIDKHNLADILLLPLEGDREPIPLVNTPFDEELAVFSPDGRWIAYNSDESGRPEVYVMPFCPPTDPPGDGDCDRSGRWQVSTGGGIRPHWARDGKSLYYQTLDRTLTAVTVDATGNVFRTSEVEALFTPDAAVTNLPGFLHPGYGYDVTPDGQRFIVNTFGSGDATPLTLVINWPQLLERP